MSLKIVLAGYNVDREALDELRSAAPPRLDLTPETLSAAYARISRDPRPADELRRAARAEVEKARRSNRAIIFKMGHHSVAEHAVFNFDLIGVSRLAIEEIERFRLCSFTEKSQRYITLGDDFVVPEEIAVSGKRDLFVETVRAQNALYHSLNDRLLPYVRGRHPDLAADPAKSALLEGWAKEDARYAVSLATEGQLGLTANARNLELMIRRLASRPSAECREIGRRLYDLAKDVAPSIVLFTEVTDYDVSTYAALGREAERIAPAAGRAGAGRRPGPEVSLAGATPGADLRVMAALLHTVTGAPLAACLERARRSSPARRKALFKAALERMEFYDGPPREFEHAAFTFDLVVSASCFAQLKRHRLATLTWPPYDPALGATVPPSVAAVGARRELLALVARTNAAHAELRRASGPAADYVLTNAHRRRALLKVNARELYHIARLREDETAQWDIRRLSAKMTALARAAAPLTCLLMGAKDAYPSLYERVYGRKPKSLPPGFRKDEGGA